MSAAGAEARAGCALWQQGSGHRTPSPPIPTTSATDDWELDPAEIHFNEKIASGAFGDLYKGVYCGQEVAIKILRNVQTDTQQYQEFLQACTPALAEDSPLFLSLTLAPPCTQSDRKAEGLMGVLPCSNLRASNGREPFTQRDVGLCAHHLHLHGLLRITVLCSHRR